MLTRGQRMHTPAALSHAVGEQPGCTELRGSTILRGTDTPDEKRDDTARVDAER